MPEATRARPTGVTSNRPKGFSLNGAMRSLSRIRGLEPTRVTVPPRMAEKPIGMRSLLMGMLRFLLMRCTAGRNRAAAPIFCMKLEIMATVSEMKITIRDWLRPATFKMGPTRRFTTPVLSNPAPIIITAMMDTTALLDRPEKASAGVTKCKRGRTTIIRMATTSTRTHSTMNRNTAIPIIIMTRIISTVNSGM